MKKIIVLFIFLIPVIPIHAQPTAFHVRFSEPLAVFEFVNNLSSHAPNNSFKRIFDSSAYNREPYTKLIAAYDMLTIDYSYEFTAYPYGQKIGGSTASLLKKSLISSSTIDEFKISAVGIIPNANLFALTTIIQAFLPAYRELIYMPNKAVFEKQLADIRDLIATKHIGAYFDIGRQFYNATWDSTIPFEFCVYPLPQSRGFTATAFFNNAVSGVQTNLADYNKLLGVMLHEIFHILYDEQSLAFKQQVETWFDANPSKNSRYAYLLLNEAVATALGNGYVYGQLNGKEDTAVWYRRPYTNLMAKQIYPVVKSYVEQHKPMDQQFVDSYIKTLDDHFPKWSAEMDFVMTDRYVLTDDPADFDTIDRKFPYRSMTQYETPISMAALQKMKAAPITKVIVVGKDNKRTLALIKSNFDELKEERIDEKMDYMDAVPLKDKTWLLIINKVTKTTGAILGMVPEGNLNFPARAH